MNMLFPTFPIYSQQRDFFQLCTSARWLPSKSRLFTDLIQTMKNQTIKQIKYCSNS